MKLILPDGVQNRNKAILRVAVQSKAYLSADGKPMPVLGVLKFALFPGQTTAIIGPSGCGKSTLLRMISELDSQYEGHIERNSSSRLSMVFQEPRLLAWRNVEANIRLIAPHISEAALTELLEALGLTEHRKLFPGELSLGLARRVAIARAFAVEPELLLLDEPFVSLDEALAQKMRAELAALVVKNGLATLLVTHDLADAIALADQVLVLSVRPATLVGILNIDRANPPLVEQLRAQISELLNQAHLRVDVKHE